MGTSPAIASADACGVRPEQLHVYAPGEIVAEGDSGADRRRRVFFRQFRYQPSVVSGPAIDSFLMVIYRQGSVLMRRKCESDWQERIVQPGDISVLGAGQPSAWEWDLPIEVSHLYLSYDLLAEPALTHSRRIIGGLCRGTCSISVIQNLWRSQTCSLPSSARPLRAARC